MSKDNTRLNRINEELKKKISHVITFELKNSNITGLVSVTKVKITPDLRFARVYVSLLNSKSKTKTMAGLQSAAGYIRGQIAKKINLRITPDLQFELDESIEYGEKMDKIIADVLKKDKELLEKNKNISSEDGNEE
jgi:ribosome-binding factor A